MDKLKLATGKVLISEPFMLDAHFKRTVVLLADYHNEEGTVGFILNRKTLLKLSDVTSDFGDFDADVHYGGPVDQDSMYFIHNVGDLLDDSIQISRGVYWSGNYEKLKVLIQCQLIGAQNIRFYIGYSGWSSGQLEQEMTEQSWIISDMDPNFIFRSNPEHLWKDILDHKGYHFSALGQLEGDELMN
ncbi:MAG TPA: YqgE/AlgH family protein [Saprospiraceae bacterium]|nr:YqgE/AlgH family protein [Saprospiraceae bacterium]